MILQDFDKSQESMGRQSEVWLPLSIPSSAKSAMIPEIHEKEMNTNFSCWCNEVASLCVFLLMTEMNRHQNQSGPRAKRKIWRVPMTFVVCFTGDLKVSSSKKCCCLQIQTKFKMTGVKVFDPNAVSVSLWFLEKRKDVILTMNSHSLKSSEWLTLIRDLKLKNWDPERIKDLDMTRLWWILVTLV